MYSAVMSTSAWPAVFEASIALPPTSCRQVTFARRNECGPSPGKSQPSAYAAWWSASRTPASHNDWPGCRFC